jgi:hypothetical protein
MFEKIRHLTGQEIDCYAHARFQDGNLQALQSTIVQLLLDIEGIAELDVIDEGHSEKVRTAFVHEQLADVLKIIHAARERGAVVRFEGD